MKNILVAAFFIILSQSVAHAQPVARFAGVEHDFGSVLQGESAEHVFEFSNEGDADLLVEKIVASSGNTKAVASPSRLKPGEKGSIKVVVDLRGKKGFFSKKVDVYTNDPITPVTTLAVKIAVRDRIHMSQYKAADIFTGECRECHVNKGQGKMGWDLFKADCFMCHNAGRNTSLSTMSKKPAKEMRKAIAEGVADTLMPGFDLNHGGPLGDTEIDSLVELITR